MIQISQNYFINTENFCLYNIYFTYNLMIEIPQNYFVDQDFFLYEYFSSNSFSEEVGIVRCVPCRHGSDMDRSTIVQFQN